MDVNFVVASPSDPENKITLGIAHGLFYASASQGRQQVTVKLSASGMADIADATSLILELAAQDAVEDVLPLDYGIDDDIDLDYDELELEPISAQKSKIRRAKTLAEAVADGSLTPRDGALQ